MCGLGAALGMNESPGVPSYVCASWNTSVKAGGGATVPDVKRSQRVGEGGGSAGSGKAEKDVQEDAVRWVREVYCPARS